MPSCKAWETLSPNPALKTSQMSSRRLCGSLVLCIVHFIVERKQRDRSDIHVQLVGESTRLESTVCVFH